jgi:pyruvate/2-oxoglutarate dehydrogenase complex dihydrolipoamide acyltransferase (E2) component
MMCIYAPFLIKITIKYLNYLKIYIMLIKTPNLGTNDNLATIVELNFTNENKVKLGEIICTLETTKSTFDVEANAEGYIGYLVEVGQEVSISESIAIISESVLMLNEEMDKIRADNNNNKKSNTASKKAIDLAKILSIDINKIKTNEIIREKDVKDYAKKYGMQKSLVDSDTLNNNENINEVIDLIGNKKAGKDLMLSSKANIPHSYIERSTIVDEWIKKVNQKLKHDDTYITILSLIIYGSARALKKNKIFNSFRKGDQILIYDKINIGVVISNDNQISIPILKGVDNLKPDEIVITLMEMRKILMSRNLNIKNLIGGTFTVSALDHTNVTSFTPIVHPDQAAVLAIPRIQQKLCLDKNNSVIYYNYINLGISFDHSYLDANQANNFLDTVVEEIENCYS